MLNGQDFDTDRCGVERVSLLIVMDSVVEPMFHVSANSAIDATVSILVVMDSVVELVPGGGSPRRKSVSILVVMDSVVERKMSDWYAANFRCFNPCCNG